MFDSNDKNNERHTHYRKMFTAQDRAELAKAGWVERDFDAFGYNQLSKLNFSRGSQLIDLPTSAIGLDLSFIEYSYLEPGKEQLDLERQLRVVMLESFKQAALNEICSVVDPYHDVYSFIPAQIETTDSPWPFDVAEYTELTAFSNADCSQGLFFNCYNNHLIAHGEVFVDKFGKAFPDILTSAEQANNGLPRPKQKTAE